MRVSQKADYALRAMLELAMRSAEPRPMRSSEIAERAGVPEKFLEAILVELRNAGLVRSRRGPEGGHNLARPAGQVSVAEIRQAIDGPLALAGRRAAPGSSIDRALRGLWLDVERAIGGVLENVTLEDLRRKAEAERNVPDYSI